jgi:glutamate-5-semialdehyde dehydrogenase
MNTPVKNLAIKAKKASIQIATATTEQKNRALQVLTENLQKGHDEILQANRQDLELAKENGLGGALLERLSLQNRLPGIIFDIHQIIRLPDPVGELLEERELPNHLQITKCRTPIGVLGVIYESRPNVTLDISALAIKSGNCVILKGGKETSQTNRVLVGLIQNALTTAGLPCEVVQLMLDTDRSAIQELLQLHEYIDLIIPRGGASLQQFCREHSKIPLIIGGIGICHLYVDEVADITRSLEVVVNAKTDRCTACNALNTLLVHASIAPIFIQQVIKKLSQKGVSFRLDAQAVKYVQDTSCQLAKPSDWDTEWLSFVLGIKVVKDLSEAVDHIARHGTGHSDGILTESRQNGELFIRSVDSAAVYVNASTRFTDGAEFGLGAEVAVSTQKVHARGPMGLNELTSYKWIVRGNYQVRK